MAPGDRYHCWTVLQEGKRRGHRGYFRYFTCRCQCGTVKDILMQSLTDGRSKSCGCQRDADTSIRNRTHGMSNTTEYESWAGAKRRCYQKSCPSYRLYGALGITMCDRWRRDFAAFLADMGKKPYPAATLERIDSKGHYEPANCRWASKAEQSRNTSRNLIITHDGITMTASEWSRKLGGNDLLVSCRIRRGWSPVDAVSTPLTPIDQCWLGHR